MFDTTITLFNYSETEDTYYPILINDAEFQPIYRTEPLLNGVDNRTSCLVIVPVVVIDDVIYLYNGDKSYYMTPKQWQEASNKTQVFTFQNDIDFIIKGNKTNIVNPNLNEIKNKYDDVFMVNEIRNFTDNMLSHFELKVN